MQPNVIAATCSDRQVEFVANASYLRTKNSELQIEEVQELIPKFQPLSVDDTNRGFDSDIYWIRIILLNPRERSFECWLSVGSPRIQRVSLYQNQYGAWERIDSGTAIPRNLRPLPFSEAVFPLLLKAGEERELYLQVKSETAIDLTVSIGSPVTYHRHAEQRMFIVAIGVGGALIASVLSFVAFGYLRDRQFVPFGTLYFSGLLLDTSREGLLPYLFWPGNMPYLPQITVISGVGGLISLVLVLRNTLSLFEHLPRWDKAFKLGAYALISAIPLSFVSYSTAARGLGVIAVVFFALSIILTMQCARRGVKSARLIVGGFGLFWLFESLRQVKYMSWYQFLPPLDLPMTWSLLIASSLIVVALLNRTQELSKELFATQASNKAKSDFLARVSHELKTPLNAIIGYARMLNRQSGRISFDSGTRDIIDNGVHLMDMINELLDQSRIDLGRFVIVREQVFLQRWLNDACRFSRQLTVSYGNTFSFRIENKLPNSVSFDPRRLRQVIDNLISNANRHTLNGRIELSVNAETSSFEKIRLLFRVSDTGSGIPPEDQQLVFAPFFQSRVLEEPTRKRSGIGLGLSISREIVRLMDGNITFESRPGIGSTFSFWIDCEEKAHEDMSRSEIAAFDNNFAFAGLQALFITPNDDLFDCLVEKIGSLGLSTCRVSSLDDAVVAIETESREWSVVLLDLQWRNDELIEFVQWVREREPGVYVVGVSDHRLEAEEALKSTLDGVLMTESSVESLSETLSIVTLPKDIDKIRGADKQVLPSGQIDQNLSCELERLVEAGEITGIETWCDKLAITRPDLSQFIIEVRRAAYEIDLPTLRALANSKN